MEVTVVGNSSDRVTRWIDLAFDEIARIERIASSYDTVSTLANLNRSGALAVDNFSDELIALIDRSVALGRLTGGAFDVTLGPVRRLWELAEKRRALPTAAQVSSALARTGLRQVRWIPAQDDSIRLAVGASLDLGGIAKGYAVDRAVRVLKRHGAVGGMVNAGGDLSVFGRSATKTHWSIGVRHPRKTAAHTFSVLTISDGSIATTGDYERGFAIGDSIYPHVLDPETGWPARKAISATVFTSTAERADALATAVFVAGPDSGMALLNRLPQATGLVVMEKDGGLIAYTSVGFLENAVIDTGQVSLVMGN